MQKPDSASPQNHGQQTRPRVRQHQHSQPRKARAGALVTHHPAWVGHHTGGFRSTPTVHPCPLRWEGCGWLNSSIHTEAASTASVKSRQGRNVSAERKVGECFQWKATGQCSRGDSCNSIYREASGNRRDHSHGFYSGQRAQSSSSTSRTLSQIDGRKPCRNGSPRRASPSGLMKGRRPCR